MSVSETNMSHTSCFSAPSFCSPGTGSWHLSPSMSLLHPHPEPPTGKKNFHCAGLASLCPQPVSSYQEPLAIHLVCPVVHAEGCWPQPTPVQPFSPKALSWFPKGRTFPWHSRYEPRGQLEVCAWIHHTNFVCPQLPKTQERRRVHCIVSAAWPLLSKNTQAQSASPAVARRKKKRTHTYRQVICTAARSESGGSRKEIIVATSWVPCAEKSWWLYWCYWRGVRASSSLMCHFLSSAPYFILSIIHFLLNTQLQLGK